MTFIVHRKASSVIYPIRVLADDKTPIIGLTSATPGLAIDYRAVGQTSWSSIALSAGVEGSWSSGGFVQRASGDGWYELGVPNAAIVEGVTTDIRVKTNGNGYRYGSIAAIGASGWVLSGTDPKGGTIASAELPRLYDFDLVQNDDYESRYWSFDLDLGADVDLTNATAVLVGKHGANTITGTATIVAVDGGTGELQIRFDRDNTVAPEGHYPYVCKVVTVGDGEVISVLHGTIRLARSTTPVVP